MFWLFIALAASVIVAILIILSMLHVVKSFFSSSKTKKEEEKLDKKPHQKEDNDPDFMSLDIIHDLLSPYVKIFSQSLISKMTALLPNLKGNTTYKIHLSELVREALKNGAALLSKNGKAVIRDAKTGKILEVAKITSKNVLSLTKTASFAVIRYLIIEDYLHHINKNIETIDKKLDWIQNDLEDKNIACFIAIIKWLKYDFLPTASQRVTDPAWCHSERTSLEIFKKELYGAQEDILRKVQREKNTINKDVIAPDGTISERLDPWSAGTTEAFDKLTEFNDEHKQFLEKYQLLAQSAVLIDYCFKIIDQGHQSTIFNFSNKISDQLTENIALIEKAAITFFDNNKGHSGLIGKIVNENFYDTHLNKERKEKIVTETQHARQQLDEINRSYEEANTQLNRQDTYEYEETKYFFVSTNEAGDIDHIGLLPSK